MHNWLIDSPAGSELLTIDDKGIVVDCDRVVIGYSLLGMNKATVKLICKRIFKGRRWLRSIEFLQQRSQGE